MFSQERSLRFGGWSTPLRVIDEEVLQSVTIPVGTTEARWEQVIQVANETTTPDGRDYFVLTLKDAHSGLNLLSGGGVVIDGESDFQGGWYHYTIRIGGLESLAGRSVGLSYVGFSEDDLSTSLVLDSIHFYTTCASE